MQRNHFNWIFRSVVCLRCFFCLLLNCNVICFLLFSLRKSIGRWLLEPWIHLFGWIYERWTSWDRLLSLSRRWTVDGQRIFFFCTSRILFRWITHSERRSQTQLNHHKINTNEQQQKIWYRSHTFDGTESGRRVRVARFLSIEVITLHRTYQITLTVCSFGILVSVVRVPSVCA